MVAWTVWLTGAHTVYLPEGVAAQGVCLPGGVTARECDCPGGMLLPGGCTCLGGSEGCTCLGCICPGGVPAHGVRFPGGVVEWEINLLGGGLSPLRCTCPGGCCCSRVHLPRGCGCMGVCILACTEADTSSPMDRMTDICKSITLLQLHCGQ